MRALGSLLLVLAQLRPVLGILLCAAAAPVTPAAEGGCTGEEHPPAGAPMPADHGLRWDAAGTPTGPACGLAELCSPAGQAPVAATVTVAPLPVPARLAVILLVVAPHAESTAPPTPPPNS